MECAVRNVVDFQRRCTLPQIPSTTTLSFSTHFPLSPPSSTAATAVNSLETHPSTTIYRGLLQPLLVPSRDSHDFILPVDCGLNAALLYLSKLCQGSKGQCILFQDHWLTPNEFQYISGRVTAKDWKRSIRHNGKSLKLLISKGALVVHSPLCDCGNQQATQRMELLHNNNATNSHPPFPHQVLLRSSGIGSGSGVKRESRLTSIIDHLLISRTNEESRSCSSSESESWYETSSGASGRSGCSLLRSDSKGFSPPITTLTLTRGSGAGEVKSLQMSTSAPLVTVSPEAASAESAEDEHLNAPHQASSTPLTPSQREGNGGGAKSSKLKKRTPVIKNERQSPESVRSSPSPSKPGSGGGSGAPSPPLKQMEQMMGRNYSDFMRSLAAKYNHANPNDLYTSAARSSSFNFDSRFLKPGAAAAAASLLAFQQQQVAVAEKLQFPLIDMSSTQTLLSMVRSAAASANPTTTSTSTLSNGGLNVTTQQLLGGLPAKRPSSPLDLSSAAALVGLSKKAKSQGGGVKRCGSNCSGCSSEAEAIVTGWTVEDVCRFVSSIDLCAEYVQAFRDHSIDGSSLPLLTEEHLIQNMSMKLGPALKFKSTVAKKLGNCPVCIHCTHCHVPPDVK